MGTESQIARDFGDAGPVRDYLGNVGKENSAIAAANAEAHAYENWKLQKLEIEVGAAIAFFVLVMLYRYRAKFRPLLRTHIKAGALVARAGIVTHRAASSYAADVRKEINGH